MKTRTKIIQLLSTGLNGYFLLLLLIGLVFVFLAALSEIFISGLELSISSFKRIHEHPSLWILYLIPPILILNAYIINRHIGQIKEGLGLKIKGLKKKISTYADHVNQMSQENYSIPVIPEGKDDLLGHALYFLQGSLRATSRKENNQNWISEGRELISRILRTKNNLEEMPPEVLKSLTNYLDFVQGAFYIYEERDKLLTCMAVYAFNQQKYIGQTFRIGEGLVGQCAFEMDYIYRTEIPESYLSIKSGLLGEKKPESLLLIPLISEDKLFGILEFAALNPKIPKLSIQFLLEIGEEIGRTLYNLKITSQTEALLKESQSMTEALKRNEKTLEENAKSMEAAQTELQESNRQLEEKIREVELVQRRMQWLLKNASEITSIYDSGCNLTYISPSVEKILGYHTEEMIQGKNIERMSREGETEFREMLLEVIKDPNSSPVIQYFFITRAGTRLSLESTAKNRLSDPSIKGIVVNTRDITERIRAEKEERLKTKMQSLSENSLDMIMRLSVTGQFFYINPMVEHYIGCVSNQILNKSLSEVTFNKSLHYYLEKTIHEQVRNPVKTIEELTIPVKIDNRLTEKTLSIDAIPEFINDELETILFVGHDITDSKRIEKEVREKSKNIQDSIDYAKKIQTALLPEIEKIRSFLPKSFVYYKPRDIVSGDFPWFYTAKDHLFLAVVDCTGHGVPGALLSFIAFFLMKETIEKNIEENPGTICNILHEKFRETLKQTSRNAEARDGFDIGLCKIKRDYTSMQFAGAHRPIYHLSGGELNDYKGDRKSIGGIPLLSRTEIEFTHVDIELAKGDKIFLFSDGITDQLGGPYGRKYTPQRLRDNILANPGLTMPQFYDMYSNKFENWKTGFKQLDDVLVVGVEF